MLATNNDIENAITQKIAEAKQTFEKVYNNQPVDDIMVPVVYKQKASPRKWFVGFRFAEIGTKVSDIQKDSHSSYDQNQEIVWVCPHIKG